MKVIVDLQTGTTHLYDIRSDPGEIHNLADDEHALREPLNELEEFFEAHRRRFYKRR